ncbi:hypothetical protein CJ030_MR5G009754 [Morella rubra]|uniref:Uncharacterized protein n=1 Tax=Morella rubra TaxID=262757 RepID=A0A6A1VIG7_9ROSI|nr:hypothetical protein CJ030_MR5G009754 [Morella rubra]
MSSYSDLNNRWAKKPTPVRRSLSPDFSVDVRNGVSIVFCRSSHGVVNEAVDAFTSVDVHLDVVNVLHYFCRCEVGSLRWFKELYILFHDDAN